MNKKTFEIPEIEVTVLEEVDILELSPNESGNTPSLPW